VPRSPSAISIIHLLPRWCEDDVQSVDDYVRPQRHARRDVGVFFCLVNVVTGGRRPPAERPAKYGVRGGGPRCHDAGVDDVQPYLEPAHRGPAHRHSDDVVIIVVGFIVVPIVVIIRRRRVEAAASLCRTNAGRRQGGDAVAVASSLVTYPSQSSKPTGEGLNCIQKATH